MYATYHSLLIIKKFINYQLLAINLHNNKYKITLLIFICVFSVYLQLEFAMASLRINMIIAADIYRLLAVQFSMTSL